MGIRFLANRAIIFCGNSKNYYLSIASVKSLLWQSIYDFNLWALLGGKMGLPATPAPKGLGPQNPTKKLAYVGFLLSHFFISKWCSQTFRHWTPPPLNKTKQNSINVKYQ